MKYIILHHLSAVINYKTIMIQFNKKHKIIILEELLNNSGMAEWLKQQFAKL